MKQILLVIAVVVLVGCGKSKEELTNTSPDVAEVTDLNLEKALVKSFFHVPNRKIRYTDQVRRTLRLDLENSSIKSANGLQVFRNLERLALNNNQLTDVTGLANLTQLSYLRLNDNQLTNVKGLLEMPPRQGYLVLYIRHDTNLTEGQVGLLKAKRGIQVYQTQR